MSRRPDLPQEGASLSVIRPKGFTAETLSAQSNYLAAAALCALTGCDASVRRAGPAALLGGSRTQPVNSEATQSAGITEQTRRLCASAVAPAAGSGRIMGLCAQDQALMRNPALAEPNKANSCVRVTAGSRHARIEG